jgi:hypothetical protein
MYLFVLEDGELRTTDNITQGDRECVSMGILDIVNMTDGTQLTDEGEWVKIEHNDNH